VAREISDSVMVGRSMLKTPRMESARAVTERVAAGGASVVRGMTSVMVTNVETFSLNEKVFSGVSEAIGGLAHVFRGFLSFRDFWRAFTQ
jgi:hypothetical protein